jgi:hypothetical protein
LSTFVDATAHGFVAGNVIGFANLEGGQGIVEGTPYYVLAAGLTANTFQFSATAGGAAFTFDSDITAGDVALWSTYSQVADGVMDAPVVAAAPTAPTLGSAAISSVVRLTVTLVDTPSATIRNYEVEITHKYSGATPQWDGAIVFTVQPTTTSVTAPALGSTKYGVRVRSLDVYGNASAYSSTVEHTTLAGADSLTASVLDHTITSTEISDLAISTPKLAANAVTAAKIAADTITANEIAANAITSNELAANAVTAGKIAAGTITTADLNASASISLVSNAGATVVIDSTGITITSGKMTFKDSNGDTVLDQYGFGSSWLRFLTTRVYNGDFAAGSTSDIAVSETGSGTPTANYKASVSPNLPYWVVAASDATVAIVADSTASAGKALKITQTGANQTSRIYQDLPIEPNNEYLSLANIRMTFTGATDLGYTTYVSYRASDHSLIGTRLSNGLVMSTNVPAYTLTAASFGMGDAPANAVYIRLEIEVVQNAYTAVTKFSQLWISDAILSYGDILANSVEANVAAFGVTSVSDLTVTGNASVASGLTLTDLHTSVYGGANIALTTTDQNIVTISGLTAGRRYLAIYTADLAWSTVSAGTAALVTLYDGASAATGAPQIILQGDVINRIAGLTQQFIITPTNTTVSIKTKKSVNAGVATLRPTHTSLTLIPM